MLNTKTPPTLTVTFCFKWLDPSLPPNLTDIFWMAPKFCLLCTHFQMKKKNQNKKNMNIKQIYKKVFNKVFTIINKQYDFDPSYLGV
jgi:hypothetical protein